MLAVVPDDRLDGDAEQGVRSEVDAVLAELLEHADTTADRIRFAGLSAADRQALLDAYRDLGRDAADDDPPPARRGRSPRP